MHNLRFTGSQHWITLKRHDLDALCEAIACSDFVAKRYLRFTLQAVQELSENGAKPVTIAALTAKLGHNSTRMGHLLTALERGGHVLYRYGAGLPEDGAWELAQPRE